MITRLLSPDWIYTLGWTLIDTLWMGAAFALLLGICLILMRRFSSQARYTLAIGLLFAFLLTTLFSGIRHYRNAPSQIAQTVSVETVSPPLAVDQVQLDFDVATQPTTTTVTPGLRARLVEYYDQHLPLIVTF